MALFLVPGHVMAQEIPLLIVPFDKEQMDDEMYKRVMDQIKADVAQNPEYKVLPDIEQGMTDLLFSVDCAEPDPECLQQIGETFGAEMILTLPIVSAADRRRFTSAAPPTEPNVKPSAPPPPEPTEVAGRLMA